MSALDNPDADFNVTVDNSGDIIGGEGSLNVHGIVAMSEGNTLITNNGALKSLNQGITALADGDITITNNAEGEIELKESQHYNGNGIFAASTDSNENATGKVSIANKAKITTLADYSRGIEALSYGEGVVIDNSDAITTSGKWAEALDAHSTGYVKITNSGALNTNNGIDDGDHGVVASGSVIEVENSGGSMVEPALRRFLWRGRPPGARLFRGWCNG